MSLQKSALVLIWRLFGEAEKDRESVSEKTSGRDTGKTGGKMAGKDVENSGEDVPKMEQP